MTTANVVNSPANTNPTATVAPKQRNRISTKAVQRKAAPKAKSPKAVLHSTKAAIASPVKAVHVWLAKHGKGLARSAACAKLDAMGIAYYTVRTQYQVWYSNPKASHAKYVLGKKPARKVASTEEGEE